MPTHFIGNDDNGSYVSTNEIQYRTVYHIERQASGLGEWITFCIETDREQAIRTLADMRETQEYMYVKWARTPDKYRIYPKREVI
jgi:hypothetical protein